MCPLFTGESDDVLHDICSGKVSDVKIHKIFVRLEEFPNDKSDIQSTIEKQQQAS